MAASPRKSLALDTNLLLDLAGEKDFAHEFAEEFSSRGYSLLVPPTVIAELALFASLKDAEVSSGSSGRNERLGIEGVSLKCEGPPALPGARRRPEISSPT